MPYSRINMGIRWSYRLSLGVVRLSDSRHVVVDSMLVVTVMCVSILSGYGLVLVQSGMKGNR